jgi:hypothetical protein
MLLLLKKLKCYEYCYIFENNAFCLNGKGWCRFMFWLKPDRSA